MRKFSILLLITVFLVISYFSLRKEESYEVLKINSAVEFFVDFNGNKTFEENELIQLFELDNEPEIFTREEIIKLNYLANEYAKQKLLNKKIKVVSLIDGTKKIILSDGEDYAELLLQKGYIFSKKYEEVVRKNLKYADTLDLVSYNTNSGKYHTLDCKYAMLSRHEKITEKSALPKGAKPCKFCHFTKKYHKKIPPNYPRDIYEKYMPVYKDSNLEFYVTDFTKYYYPSEKCLTTACMSLLKEIKSAESTIDFAIYGIDRQPEIANALSDAQKRGVNIRWVYDTNKSHKTIYMDTFKLKKILTNAKSDIEYSTPFLPDGKRVRDSIMHNKFFIFDNKKVWTGSANITHTDLSGFNANSVVLISSQEIAELYKAEFEKMYSGDFHQLKAQTPANSVKLSDSIVSVYFSPQDKIITKHILPLINNAQKYIYIPVFVITHKDFNQALINAKKRGVEVRVIVDATSAGAKYSSVKLLRENNIKVKTENRAGKMHMKSIIIDDKYTVTGSMNFTKSGESYNDENVIILQNPQLTQKFKQKFLYLYNSIPDKWLNKNPRAESLSSINSCFDGVDNDFDGKTDMEDDSCNYKLRKKKN